jgi:hypothetical protein
VRSIGIARNRIVGYIVSLDAYWLMWFVFKGVDLVIGDGENLIPRLWDVSTVPITKQVP